MPIKPENKARYPKDWKAIVAKVRAKVWWTVRVSRQSAASIRATCPRRCVEVNGQAAQWARGTVVLTVAHLDHTPEHCDLENLRDMCQRCHLRYDVPHHRATSRRTRETKTGQRNMLEAARE